MPRYLGDLLVPGAELYSLVASGSLIVCPKGLYQTLPVQYRNGTDM
jgi:hypothetical protein